MQSMEQSEWHQLIIKVKLDMKITIIHLELFVIKYKMQSSYFIWTQSDELLQETLIKDSKLQNIKSNPHFLWTVDWRQ